jgi:hypothetical protein
MNSYSRVGFIVGIAILTTLSATLLQKVYAARGSGSQASKRDNGLAPIATSGDKNVYVVWWSNKTGNDEVMFKASTDSGKSFGDKMNLSNTPNSESQDAEIAASANNVYVSWWERNATSNEPVLRISNDNGKTFGEKIILSAK